MEAKAFYICSYAYYREMRYSELNTSIKGLSLLLRDGNTKWLRKESNIFYLERCLCITLLPTFCNKMEVSQVWVYVQSLRDAPCSLHQSQKASDLKGAKVHVCDPRHRDGTLKLTRMTDFSRNRLSAARNPVPAV